MVTGMDHSELLSYLQQLGNAINSSMVTLGEVHENTFDLAATASIIKAYEFCKKAAGESQDQSFFLLASLRGICEDYIVLKFIQEQADDVKNDVIRLRMLEETHESSIAQWNFFKDNHPAQRLYYKDSFEQETQQVRADLRKLMKGHPVRKRASMPSVYYMADKVGMLPFYRYIYHATSQFVHFSPRLLLRMGWDGPPRFTIATANFGDYYHHFSVFYGTFLLTAIFEWLCSTNSPAITDRNPPVLILLRNFLHDTSRWPELVTFEEMNIGALSRNLFFEAPGI
jgi:Family of unknown function (DUF5677)